MNIVLPFDSLERVHLLCPDQALRLQQLLQCHWTALRRVPFPLDGDTGRRAMTGEELERNTRALIGPRGTRSCDLRTCGFQTRRMALRLTRVRRQSVPNLPPMA